MWIFTQARSLVNAAFIVEVVVDSPDDDGDDHTVVALLSNESLTTLGAYATETAARSVIARMEAAISIGQPTYRFPEDVK